MAQLSYEEKITRLQNRLDELVKPAFVIAEDKGESIAAVIIMSNGRKHHQNFTPAAFKAFIAENEDCNIIVDDDLLSIKQSTIEDITAEMETETLLGIVNGTADAKELKKLLFVKVVEKIR